MVLDELLSLCNGSIVWNLLSIKETKFERAGLFVYIQILVDITQADIDPVAKLRVTL